MSRRRDRRDVCLLLGSASHSSIDRLLEAHDHDPHTQSKRYTLEIGKYRTNFWDRRPVLLLSGTPTEPDAKTAASQALLLACWQGDLDMVKQIVHNLRGIIDVNTLLGNKNVLSWTLRVNPNNRTTETTISKANICRFLIVEYGSNLNANRCEDDILRICSNYSSRGSHSHSDIVAYLVTAYGPDLASNVDVYTVFECLARGNHEEEAKTYLHLYTDLSIDAVNAVLVQAITWASIPLFEFVMDMYQSRISAGCVSDLFETFSNEDQILHYEDKIRIVYNKWAHHLTPKIIKRCLVELWSKDDLDNVDLDDYTDIEASQKYGSCKAHTIIEVCMPLICNRGIEIAMVHCCISPNIQLLDTLIAFNLEQIRSEPQLVTHALLVCACQGEIDILRHLLMRLGLSISAAALEFWCMAGDIEAVAMILDIEPIPEPLIDRLPIILKRLCSQGDVDMVELLIKTIGDSIKESDYVLAFYEACRHGHKSIVEIMINLCGHIHFDSSLSEFDMTAIDPDIIQLLNETFGTTIDSNSEAKLLDVPLNEYVYCVEYRGWPKKMYFLDGR